MRIVSLACAVLVVSALPAAGQDPLKVAPTQYKLVAENDRVRVMHVTLAPGASAAMHSHPDHIGVVLTGGTLRMGTPDGKTQDIEAKADQILSTPAGSHTTANAGKTAVEVIVIEMKGSPGTATPPPSRPGMKMTSLLQDARASAYKVSIDSTFHEPAGTTHPFDQVVIPLGAGDVALTMDGKTTSTWKRGDVRLIGHGVAHETKGGKIAGEMIIVAIK